MTAPLRPASTLRRVLAAAVLPAACLPSRAAAFALEDVARRVEALARAPYHEPARELPDALRQLGYDQYRDIRYRPERALWRRERLPFEVMFFHQGFSFTAPVTIHDFFAPRQLFPTWPEWHEGRAVALMAATSAVLFLPKALGAGLALARGSREFGGPWRLVVSTLVETAASAVIAPVRMVFHALFVPTALAGLQVEWRSPQREDTATTWRAALRRYGPATLLGLGWGAAVHAVAPAFLWWILPVVGPLAISIPVAVLSSRPALGRRLRRARVFAIPEETRPPVELRLMRRELGRAAPRIGLADAVVDPAVNAVACAAAAPRPGGDRPLVAATRRRVVVAALRGPEALGDRERHLLLADARALAEVHAAVQASPQARARWVAARAAPAERATGAAGRPA